MMIPVIDGLILSYGNTSAIADMSDHSLNPSKTVSIDCFFSYLVTTILVSSRFLHSFIFVPKT